VTGLSGAISIFVQDNHSVSAIHEIIGLKVLLQVYASKEEAMEVQIFQNSYISGIFTI